MSCLWLTYIFYQVWLLKVLVYKHTEHTFSLYRGLIFFFRQIMKIILQDDVKLHQPLQNTVGHRMLWVHHNHVLDGIGINQTISPVHGYLMGWLQVLDFLEVILWDLDQIPILVVVSVVVHELLQFILKKNHLFEVEIVFQIHIIVLQIHNLHMIVVHELLHRKLIYHRVIY